MRDSNYSFPPRLDEAPTSVGDDRWVGVNRRLAPRLLAPNFLAKASNVRMRSGQVATRGGTERPVWAHRLTEAGAPRAWGRWKGACNFRNPDNVAWLIVVDDTGIWRLYPNNVPSAVPLPAYAGLPARVSLTQAFNKLFLFRGRGLRPLVCDDLDLGFRDVVGPWDSGVAYPAGSLVGWGPWTTLSAGALTAVGNEATLVFPAAHGLVSGADLTVRGAAQADYNGRFQVTVVDEVTVTMTLLCTPGATPATGTVLVSDQTAFWGNASGTSAGDEPGITGWARSYTILPNGIEAAFLNNRLCVPTAYLPGATTAVAGTLSPKADYLAVTDVLDFRQFYLSGEFRINQGSADELLCVIKGNASSIVAFKGESVYLVNNVSGDLSQLSLEQIKDVYGIVNGRAVTTVGKDLVFVSPKRGVVSLIQSSTGALQGADVPLSEEIQPDIDRIAWQFGDRIRVAWWDNKLYVAVPLDAGRALGANRVPSLTVAPDEAGVSLLDLSVFANHYCLTVGQTYQWSPGSNTTEILVYRGVHYPTATYFTYDGGPIWLTWLGSTVASSSIQAVYTGVNNAVLVYDYQMQAWQGIDSGPGICPEEFVVSKVHGRDRLVALMSDGTVALYEASADGDAQLDGTRVPIDTEAVTRGYTAEMARWRGRRVNLSIATWATRWSLSVLNEGVNETVPLKSGVTRDRTVFRAPIGRARFDPESVGADFGAPYREDYSEVAPGGAGWDVSAAGFLGDRMQSFTEQVRIPAGAGEVTQLSFTSSGGLSALTSVGLELTQTQRREGSKV